MQKNYLNTLFFISAVNALCIGNTCAAMPLWTFSAPNPASTSVSDGETATLHYVVTNQSTRSKNLILKPTEGLSASSCYLPKKGSTCNLTLTITGTLLPSNGIHQGPVLCEHNNANQCYRPSEENQLQVNKKTPKRRISPQWVCI